MVPGCSVSKAAAAAPCAVSTDLASLSVRPVPATLLLDPGRAVSVLVDIADFWNEKKLSQAESCWKVHDEDGFGLSNR